MIEFIDFHYRGSWSVVHGAPYLSHYRGTACTEAPAFALDYSHPLGIRIFKNPDYRLAKLGDRNTVHEWMVRVLSLIKSICRHAKTHAIHVSLGLFWTLTLMLNLLTPI